MRPRRQFLPSAMESLEDRRVLSGLSTALAGPLEHIKQKATAAIGHLGLSAARADAPKIAVLGDALSNEYQDGGDTRVHARNWVELIAATGRVDFGPYNNAPEPDDPRGGGFALNWSADGATTADSLDAQLAAVTPQLATGNVKYVVLFVGSGDFHKFMNEDALTFARRPALLYSKLAKVESAAEANLSAAIRTLTAAKPDLKIVLVTIPDLTAAPALKQAIEARGGGKTVLTAVSRSIGRYNDHIRAQAKSSHQIAIADVARQFKPLMKSNGQLPYGGAIVNLSTTGDNARHFMLSDGLHPGTVAQGMIANAIINALDSRFHAGIKPLAAAAVVGVAQKVGVPEA